MLSSPGGRRKYQDIQRRRELLSSPMKRSNTTPNFKSKANQVLDEEEGAVDGEEDEETLQLKLAEIQARLKLKQLQKSRGRSGTVTSNPEDDEGVPSSVTKTHARASAIRSPPPAHRRAPSDGLQVPMSPTRKPAPAAEPWSPRRYKLGIDKGWKASDVLLKRPPSTRQDPRPASHLGTRGGATSRSSDLFSPRPQSSPGGGGAGAGLTRIKSFSERMAEGRAAEKVEQARLEKVERVKANRSSAFQVDNSEIEAYKEAAAKEPESALPQSREPHVQEFNREEILRSLAQAPRPGGLKRSQTASNLREGTGKRQLMNSGARKDIPSDTGASSTPDSSKFESFSSLHLSSRILPHSFLSRSIGDKTTLRIPDLLKKVKAPDFELPEEIDGDYVVFGIVASKSDPKEANKPQNTTKANDSYDDGLNNSNKYMVITLTDLKWTIDLFLFDTAFPRYYKITEGTVVAILNPTIMPPPKHKLDTNRFSLVLSSSDDKVLEIGKSQDLGFCKATRKDGKTCHSWVDGRKTEFCDFHVDLQVRRTQGQRSGVNSDSGAYGPGGRTGSRTTYLPGSPANDWRKSRIVNKIDKDNGPKYDRRYDSQVYVAPAPKNRGGNRASYNPASGDSAASLIDASDDPFIAAGMMGRGRDSKEDLFKRRMAAQQREREISQKLSAGRTGGVGADYLRTRITDSSPSVANKDQQLLASSTPQKLTTSASDLSLASFRRTGKVHLSPAKRAHDGEKSNRAEVKKTRFVTAKGIREAGRESVGGPETTNQQPIISDDDDDLEIV